MTRHAKKCMFSCIMYITSILLVTMLTLSLIPSQINSQEPLAEPPKMSKAECAKKFDELTGEYIKITKKLDAYEIHDEFLELALQCNDNIYGPKSTLFSLKIRIDLDRIKEIVMQELKEFSKSNVNKYKEVAQEAHYNYVLLVAQSGYCSEFRNELSDFLAMYQPIPENQKEKLSEYSKRCDKIEQGYKSKMELARGTGNPKKYDVLILGHGFDTLEEFRIAAEKSISNGFFYVPDSEILSRPEFQDKFNFYLYTEILPKEYCYPTASAFNQGNCFCNEKSMEDISKSIGVDSIVVLMKRKQGEKCGSCAEKGKMYIEYKETSTDADGSEYIEVSFAHTSSYAYLYDADGTKVDITDENKDQKFKSFNQNGLEILHESGHAFYNLYDEYFYKGAAISMSGGMNCDHKLEGAQRNWQDLADIYNSADPSLHPLVQDSNVVGFFNGCSYTDTNIRPTENSIMNQATMFGFAKLKGSFGPVNDRIIQRFLLGYG